MVYKPSVYLLPAAVALAALQTQQAAATSLEFDPFTTCHSYEIRNKNFPGRGGEIKDDGNCVVTVPEDPNVPRVCSISKVPVTFKSLVRSSSASPSKHVYTKMGRKVGSVRDRRRGRLRCDKSQALHLAQPKGDRREREATYSDNLLELDKGQALCLPKNYTSN